MVMALVVAVAATVAAAVGYGNRFQRRPYLDLALALAAAEGMILGGHPWVIYARLERIIAAHVFPELG
jgi:hypothetical protein